MSRCAWCGGPIPAGKRRDSKCCSVRCRQARHRFTTGVGRAAQQATTPVRLAYADPPYPGNAHLYAGHPDYAGEVDHRHLLDVLVSGYDGWALSTSSAALQHVLALCPPGVRVAAWHRGERPTRALGALTAWEPVIYRPGRAVLQEPSSGSPRRIDSLVHHARPRTTRTDRVIGAKPATFCGWLFGLLGALPGDSMTDLFPGSGGVAEAWQVYAGQAVTPARYDASDPALSDASPPAAATPEPWDVPLPLEVGP